MFGEPVAATDGDAIFHLVWTYNIKADNLARSAFS
jgi:hypothetical protein